jgi:hypothetical protein
MRFWRTAELRAGLTAQALARATGTSEDAARSAARRHGIALPAKPRGWPQRKRERVLRLVREGKPLAVAARMTGVPASTVRLWARKNRGPKKPGNQYAGRVA